MRSRGTSAASISSLSAARGVPRPTTSLEELEKDGLEETPVPSNFPQEREMSEVAYRYMNFSEGHESQQGRWASGPSKDGKGQFEYVGEPQAMGEMVEELAEVDPQLYGTPKQPVQPSSS